MMAAEVVTKRRKEKLTDDDFDYEESKAKYFEYINSTPHVRLTRRLYNKAVLDHLDPKKCKQNSQVPNSELYWDNGKKKQRKGQGNPVLILNRKTHLYDDNNGVGDLIIRYLTLENSFDILIKIHISTYHGGLTEMVNYNCEKNYTTNAIYLEFILLSCNVCVYNGLHSFERETNPDKQIIVGRFGRRWYNRVVELDYLSFDRPLYDGNFKCLFIYYDKDTRFTLLRPLLTKCPFEIATELLKIISSFGLANEFLVLPAKLKFFNDVVDQLTSLGLNHLNIKISPGYTPTSAAVLRNFVAWIKSSDHPNWGLGCHIFQWQINNTVPNILTKSPYHGNEIGSPNYTVFNDALSGLPEKYKQFKHDPFVVDSDVIEAAEIENEIRQASAITIKSKYTTTELEINKQLGNNSEDIELPKIKVEPTSDFPQYMSELEIKEEKPDLEYVEDESADYFIKQEPEVMIKDEITIENDMEKYMENLEDESNMEILGT